MTEIPKGTIGVAMIMQNEEMHIPVAISQFFHVAQDIVVIDGGSKDRSVEWAERMGARVINRPFCNDFADQKNYAVEQLSTDWIYLHDPDERLEPPLLEILPLMTTPEGQAFLSQSEILPINPEPFDCIGIPRRNFIDGVQTPIYPDYQYRFFRPYCRFEGRVHEKVVNFKHRTELDYKRPDKARPKIKKEGAKIIDTERGQLQPDIEYYDPSQISRFNILHYKSSSKQQEQDILYRKLREAQK